MKTHIFRKMLAAGAAAALVTSCIIDDPVPGPIIGGGGDDPQPEPETEFFITPDGDFADWEAIPAEQLAQSVIPDDAFYPTGKRVKAYAGATYINLYVEYRDQPEMPVQIMHLYIDGDNDQTTGMGNPAWTNDGADILFEGELFDGEGNFLGYDPTIFTFTGEPLSGEWEWEEAVSPGLGVCSISEPVELDNGNKAFEMTVLRSAVPSLGRTFRMGVGLQYDWNDIAYLPAGSAVDNHGTLEHGPAENLLLGARSEAPEEVHIDIDGELSDWEGVAAAATLPEGALYTGEKTLKIASDKDFIYLYIEYDNSEKADVGILDVWMDTDLAVDGDGKATTGCGTWIWDNDGSEILIQGLLFDEAGAPGWSGADVFLYSGAPLAGEWTWESVAGGGSGVTNSSEAVDLGDGTSAVEVSILRSAIPNLGGKVLVGVMLETSGWSESGMLPQLESPDGSVYGAAAKIAVALP